MMNNNQKNKIINIDWDSIKEKLNLKEKLLNWYAKKLHTILNEWVDYIKEINGGYLSCSVLFSGIEVKPGLLGYKITHIASGKVIAIRPYFSKRFKVNKKNILYLLYLKNGIYLDFKRKQITKKDSTQFIIVSDIQTIIVDYTTQKQTFIPKGVYSKEILQELTISIKGCENIIRLFGSELKELTH